MKTFKRNLLLSASALFFITLALLFLRPSFHAGAAEAPRLTGTVLNSDGSPIEEATVFIYTAGPRTGTSTICPSCYADCRKHATTDTHGRFIIESVSSNLLFRVLVTARDHKPKFQSRVDPYREPLTLLLDRLDAQTIGPKQSLRGRVIDPQGKPVFRAAVNFEFFYGEEANCGGACEGVDPVTVTDHKGEFLLTAVKKFDWMSVSVDASGFARGKFFQLSSTTNHDLQLREGTTVIGRIVHDGRPLKGVSVGMLSVDRSEKGSGNFETFTDSEGHFLFGNIPAYQQYFVYAIMDSIKNEGCVPVKRIRIAADGTTKDAGELVVAPGLRLTGRVVFSDGKPLPSHTHVQIGRQDAWDFQSAELDANGNFAATGLPPECFGVSLRVPGYTVSSKNESLDRLNGDSLVGLIEKDTQITILLEPGSFKQPDMSRPIKAGEDWIPKEKPLRGAPMASR